MVSLPGVTAAAKPAARVVFVALLVWMAFKVVFMRRHRRREGFLARLVGSIRNSAATIGRSVASVVAADEEKQKQLEIRGQINNQLRKRRRECGEQPDKRCDGAWKCEQDGDRGKWRCKERKEYEREEKDRCKESGGKWKDGKCKD